MSDYNNNYYYYHPNSENLNVNEITFDILTNKEKEVKGMELILDLSKGSKGVIFENVYLLCEGNRVNVTYRMCVKYKVSHDSHDTYIIHIDDGLYSIMNEWSKVSIKEFKYGIEIVIKERTNDIINAYLKVYYNEAPDDPISKRLRTDFMFNLLYL